MRGSKAEMKLTISMNLRTVLGVKTCRRHDFTSCSVLKRLEVEPVDVILGHNVEYRGSRSRLSILVLDCSEGGHWDYATCEDGNLVCILYCSLLHESGEGCMF